MCWFHSSVCPSRNNRRTKPGCRLYRSSLLGYRFDHSGSSGFVVDFCRLRLFGRGLVLKDRRNLGRYRYRYICRLAGLTTRGGCRPKRSGFGFRGRSRLNHEGMTFLKFLRFSDDLLNCKNKIRVHAFGHTYYVRATVCYGLLVITS